MGRGSIGTGPTGAVGAAVAVRGLTHRFETPNGTLTVLDALDLSVDAGGYVALTGRSGAGKSTLLSVLGGLERPHRGQVSVCAATAPPACWSRPPTTSSRGWRLLQA